MGGLASSFDSRRRRRAKETKRLMTEWGTVPVETPVIVTRDSGEKQAGMKKDCSTAGLTGRCAPCIARRALAVDAATEGVT
jgi:hypothetical protein